MGSCRFQNHGSGSNENDGIDRVGFEKLIGALGDDALDECDQVNLVASAE